MPIFSKARGLNFWCWMRCILTQVRRRRKSRFCCGSL
jgi:hypothetical protein